MCDTVEQWKVVEGYSDYYVSNLGRVFSLHKIDYLTPFVNKKGYVQISLYKNGQKYMPYLHRLVAITFMENPLQKREVDHKNGCTTDNRLCNVRFATTPENRLNRPAQSNNPTKVRGVSYVKKSKKYRARLSVDGIHFYLGVFDTIDEAKQARINKVQEVFGNNEFIHPSERM